MTTTSARNLAPAPPPRPSAADFWARWLADRPHFHRMCIRWLGGNRQEAEDVLSRGALRALEFLRNNPGRVENFRPWALRLLHNLCLDTHEAARRRPDVDDDRHDRAPGIECPIALPDRVVYGGELRAAITAALAGLPPRLSLAFHLRCIDGLGYDEICRRLDITPENARKRVQQARAFLSGRLCQVA